ncbi:nuclear exosome regulator NRDE2 [Calliphora vicina]|uniref:nuclear exosome regulator NRDE2 n=1 Tax=Calliphora vicina TaxID=7373 RepID=UPI00325B1DDD
MSLFPAYSKDNGTKDEVSHPTSSSTVSNDQNIWLENNSFDIKTQDLTTIQFKSRQVGVEISDDSSQSSSSSDEDDKNKEHALSSNEEDESRSKRFKKSKKKHKHKKSNKSSKKPIEPQLDFTGQEEFYVDKNKAKQYNTIRTLHKPACPRYRVYYYTLGRNYYNSEKTKPKRYYRFRDECGKGTQNVLNSIYALEENEYTSKMGELNRKTMEKCQDLNSWLELIALQDRNPYKWSRLRVAEKKIDYIQKALIYLPSQEELYRVYIDIITQVYTSHDVSKMLEPLLAKDPYSLILWQALIMCTQGTMARCTVPEVLCIYERCMKKMFHNHKQTATTQVSDAVMLELFYNCSLFLRQSGLYEQFFALIKLAIELNIAISSKLLEDLQPRAQDEQTLLEYEEIILQSGLPMNEIWLRIEKLRQGFNFLPYPGDNAKCSDPQRIVFNEDICHYVYPLKSQENSFKLLITILKLMKLPFISSHTLAAQLQDDTDAIEDQLAVFTNPNYICSWDQQEFFTSLFELSKEMVNTPTYLSSTIAHEPYSLCLKNLLLNCAQSYENIDERKRLIFLQLWCRFERFLLILEKLNKKHSVDFIQQTRKRFKTLLKQRQNRNCLQLYVEFALYEYEAEATAENIENIFKNLLEAYNKEENLQSELAYVYMTYAEILLKWQHYEKVSQLLSLYALNLDLSQLESITNTKKLLALSKLKEKLELTIKIEQNVEIMLLEQHFMNDYTLSQINIYCLLSYTVQQKQQSLEYLQKLLEIFKTKSNPRHTYLREHIYEIYIKILQLPKGNSYVSHKLIQQTIYSGLQEYPNNLYLLQKWGCQQSMPWYKLRAGYIKLNPSIKSVVYIIALARCRFINTLSSASISIERQPLFTNDSNDLHYHGILVRQRILNLFKVLIPSDTTQNSSTSLSLYSSLQRNSLFWRCYLSCLSDQNCSFDLSQKCLLTALDECPWSKALYLDGATYVPQELSHLQDLIIEKQLRIYALPEELEILRER